MDTLLNSRQKTKNYLHKETIIGNPIQFYSGLKGELESLVLAINQRPVMYDSKGGASEVEEPIMAGTGPNIYPFEDMYSNPKATASYPLQLPAGTYTFQAWSELWYNNSKIILNLLDGSEQEISLSDAYYQEEGTNCYYQAVFIITQPTIEISWPVGHQTLYNIQIRKGDLISNKEQSSPIPYVPYERIVPFEEPLSKGTLILSNEYHHSYNGTENVGDWRGDHSVPKHLAIPFDWENSGIVWNGTYIFYKGKTTLNFNMQMVTCGESLSPMINLRDSTGGYVNTENGLYFECGANTSSLNGYIGASINSFSEADSDVLRNGCVDNITDPGYFRTKLSTEYYNQNNYPIMGIELCLPQYCGSTLEEKRAYLADNPIQILYPLTFRKVRTFPAALPEIKAFIKQGVNRLDVFKEKYSNQEVNSQFESLSSSTNPSFSIKAQFIAPHISYAKQWPDQMEHQE